MNLAETLIPLRMASLLAFGFASGIASASPGNGVLKLLPNDGQSGDAFGGSVSISGSVAIVGARFDDDNQSQSGSAYLFDLGSSQQIAKLLPSDGAVGDFFGISVAIDGSNALVGALLDDDHGVGSGSAYVFDANTGMQRFKLLAADADVGDSFGVAVDLNATKAIIGANLDGFGDSGSAYIFDLSTGLQLGKLEASDSSNNSFFGTGVALHDTTAIVGANGENFDSGTAYLFDIESGNELAKLLPNDGATGDRFGESVAISGTIAIVGAPGDSENGPLSGSAYLFDLTTGTQLAKLLPADGSFGDSFGISVAINGTTAVVGAQSTDDGGTNSGSVYLFNTDTLAQIAKFTACDSATGDLFGSSVAIDGNAIIAGAVNNDDNGSNSGAAYTFEVVAQQLSANVASIQLSTGGQLVLTLDGGAGRAGWSYRILGSASGTSPGVSFASGVMLALQFDRYYIFTIKSSNLAAFDKFSGVLDASGQATATLTIPDSLHSSLAGLTLHHAYYAGAVLPVVDFASAPVSVTLIP